ncbi:MAG: hypothetical protein ACP5O0_10550, partial [Acidimicrobiales bacterium]
ERFTLTIRAMIIDGQYLEATRSDTSQRPTRRGSSPAPPKSAMAHSDRFTALKSLNDTIDRQKTTQQSSLCHDQCVRSTRHCHATPFQSGY